MIVQLEEAKYKLLQLTDAVKELASAIKIDKLSARIEELEEQTSAAGFWESEGSGKILQELKKAKDKIEEYNDLKAKTEDALTLAEMGIEENDESVVSNLPWEEKPAGSNAPFWRFSGNPGIVEETRIPGTPSKSISTVAVQSS